LTLIPEIFTTEGINKNENTASYQETVFHSRIMIFTSRQAAVSQTAVKSRITETHIYITDIQGEPINYHVDISS